MNHICLPFKRWWLRRWICARCLGVSKYNADTETCPGYKTDIPHDGNLCHPEAACTCPCLFCTTFPGGRK